MFTAFEWMVAMRYLRARRQEGFISVIAWFSLLGIALGVATLIIVMAVMNGFRKDLFDKILGLNGHVIVHKIGEPFADYNAIIPKLAEVPGVKNVMPIIEGQVMVSSAVLALGGLVRGMSERSLKSLPLVADNIRFGTLDGFDDQTGIAIGMRLASSLRVNVGDQITVITPRGASTPFGTSPRTKAYTIAAIFELGMSEYDKSVIFMPLGEAQKYFNKAGEVDVLEVVIDDPEKVAYFSQVLRAAGGPTVHTTDWLQRNETFAKVLQVERNVMFIILSLIILVAAFNILSSLIMLVRAKTRDIAILRTMGATRGSMIRIFVSVGLAIGTIGTLLGLGLAAIFLFFRQSVVNFVQLVTGQNLWDPSVRFLTELPARADPGDVIGVVAMALVLSFLFTLYPALRAARTDPVQVLRYE